MSLIRTASSAAITPTNTDDCNITAVCDNAAAAHPAQKTDTRSRFGRWFSNLICGGRHGPSLYASPTSYRPVVVSKTSPSRRIRQRQSLQATASERAPQVARSVTLDGPKTAGDVHDYVPEISVMPGGRRSQAAAAQKQHVDSSFLKNSRSSTMNAERSATNGSLGHAPRNYTKEARPYGQRETKEILRSMVRLADKRRLAGQHVHRHGRLVCAGLSKKDLDAAKIRVPLAKTHPWLAANYCCGGSITGSSSRTTTTATSGGSFVDNPSPGVTTWATPIQRKGGMRDSSVNNKTYNYPKLSNDVVGVNEMTLEEFEQGFYRRNTM
ncbi:hypothetical protein FOZ63_003797 [Perkinsus olseni]|uniref:Uncharacterized protein n=3 Tax=Perkinsus olseni TaxID=32597 RepID=A0A7J6PKJ6_PEROL|nr:hypothetical protein FOZ60_016663 [Perkinsus olseni]KAF4740247.1 hypothetical protein FOZ63_003797 [Perkinsus olseni]